MLRDAARDAEASVAGERSNSGALAQDQAEPGNIPATSSLPAAPSATSVPPELRPLRDVLALHEGEDEVVVQIPPPAPPGSPAYLARRLKSVERRLLDGALAVLARPPAVLP